MRGGVRRYNQPRVVPLLTNRWSSLRAVRQSVLQWRKARAPVGVILMYHRITPSGPDPWELGVSPAHFREHLDVLRRHGHATPLANLARDVASGRVAPRSVSVTFDDGFADNLLTAKPLLEAADVPATVFITTGPIGTPTEFWWDALDHLLVLPVLPDELSLSSEGRGRRWTLGPATRGSWTTGEPDSDQRARAAFHRDVWAFLQPLGHDEQLRLVDDIRRWSGARSDARATHRVMTADEIVRLGTGGLIEIGAHTVTHPHLPSMAPEARAIEMHASRGALEDILGRSVTSFSYPYGAVNPSISALARDVGFENAVAAFEQTAWRGDDRHCLPRFAVRDWDGAEFERQLLGWFSRHAAP